MLIPSTGLLLLIPQMLGTPASLTLCDLLLAAPQASLQPCTLITTEEVLGELLTFYSKSGNKLRERAVNLVEDILNSPDVEVIEQTHASFLLGLELYKNRLDKGYSLADCISMQTMRQLGITEVLTHDRHFTQEGFVILLTT